MNRKIKDMLLPVLEGLWIWLLLVWGYIAIENFIYPSWVANTNLGVYFPVPQNLLVIAAFAASFVFFVLWKYLKTTK